MQIFIKRTFDLVFGICISLLLLPIIFVSILFIIIESGFPVFFMQERLGKNGTIFKLYKLRSMKVNEKRKEQQVFSDHPDVTFTGKVIRRLKIDELPQLINVIKGDMSIVGPRPCLPQLIEKFDENGHYRLLVKPGLTGWAQVNGNVFNSWQRRWELDRYYVENQSFLFDIKILIATIGVVIFGEKK